MGVKAGIREGTYLAISNFPEGLEHLFGGILIFRNADHEADELFERHISLGPTHLPKRLFHLHLIKHKTQTRQRGRKLQLLQRVTQVPIEMPENTLELLKLDRRQIRHVARDHLVLQEAEFLRHTAFHKAEFVGKLVVSVGCEVVLLDVGFGALIVEGGEGG